MQRERLTRAEIAKVKRALLKMRPQHVLYEAVKQEMQRRGRWRVAPRGKPFQPGFDARRNKDSQIK